MIKLKQGDCLKLMQEIQSGTIDMILCDLPYGLTKNENDIALPFKMLWNEYNRIIKNNRSNCTIRSTENFT